MKKFTEEEIDLAISEAADFYLSRDGGDGLSTKEVAYLIKDHLKEEEGMEISIKIILEHLNENT